MLDLLPMFPLGIQKGGQNLRRQIARSYVNPRISVHFTPEVLFAIGPFLAKNFGTLRVRCIIDQQRTSFPTTDVLRFMKTLRRHATKSSEITTAILSKQSVRI